MKYYQVKVGKIPGTDLKEVFKRARKIYDSIVGNAKRRAHVRSKYFKKQKIFLGLFWHHIDDKLNRRDKIRRLKYFPCAIDLIINSNYGPNSIKENPHKSSEILYRFTGITKDQEIFHVQIKEDIRTREKFLISAFPV